MDCLGLYLKQIRKLHERFTATEEQELARAAKSGDLDARNKLLYSVLPMVVQIAARYRGRGVDFEDLIQLGNIGAMIAIDKFDPDRGIRLTTYSTWWIFQKVRFEVDTRGTAVRFPAPSNLAKLGHEAQRELAELRRSVVSLDTDISIDKGREQCLGAMVADKKAKRPEVDAACRETVRDMRRKIGLLRERDGQVIIARMNGKTLEQLGNEMGITRERVRQIEARGLMRLAAMFGVFHLDKGIFQDA